MTSHHLGMSGPRGELEREILSRKIKIERIRYLRCFLAANGNSTAWRTKKIEYSMSETPCKRAYGVLIAEIPLVAITKARSDIIKTTEP